MTGSGHEPSRGRSASTSTRSRRRTGSRRRDSIRGLVLALFVALATVCGACGERALGDSPCAQVCLDLRDRLIHTYGVSPQQVDCLAAKWSKARTCDDCKRVLRESYGVHVTGDEICAGF